MKLAIVTNILTPYRLPLFAAMAERVAALRVFVMASSEENRDWQLPPARFDWQVLPGWHLRPPGASVAMHVNHGVAKALGAFGPDAVLSGGFTPANVAAWAYCLRHRRAFFNWGELGAVDLRAAFPKRLLRRVLISGARGAVASSSTAREVFLHYGARPERVLRALMPIDVEGLHTRAAAYRHSDAYKAARASFSTPILLNVGRIVDSKGYRELFALYEQVLTRHPNATLLIAGDGPRRGFYQELAQQRGLSNVHFLGFQQADEVAKLLALADVFVFPTLNDPFGAVLCEAMAAELPAVASVHAAATLDLVEEGVTGFRIEPSDTAASAEAVCRLLEMSSAQRATLTGRALQHVRQFDITPTATAMVDFIDSAAPMRPAARGHEATLSPDKSGSPP
jgi:glycosyltransferase involved in cell wall biosynthesis